MKNSNKQLWSLFLILGVIIFLAGTNYGCKSKTTEESKAEEKGEVEILSADMLYPIFGRGEEETSGIYDVNQTGEDVFISYRYVPPDPEKDYDEIGKELAPKIKNFYEKFPKIDRTVFEIYVPTEEELGWKKFVSFDMTRKIFNEVEWTDLMNIDLLRIVENVNYSE